MVASVRLEHRFGSGLDAVLVAVRLWQAGVGDPRKADAECAAVGMGRCLGEKKASPTATARWTVPPTPRCAAMARAASRSPSRARPCASPAAKSGDCRDGTQCYEGICQPKCKADTDCRSDGHVCQDGACERPGKKPGETCGGDNDCQYQACLGGSCALSCQRETACGESQTCAFDRDASKVRGSCITRRAVSKTPLVSCLDDSQCQQGSCLMGVCLVLCQDARDCKSLGEDSGTHSVSSCQHRCASCRRASGRA